MKKILLLLLVSIVSLAAYAQWPMGIENPRELTSPAMVARYLDRCYKLPTHSQIDTPSTIEVKGREMLITWPYILDQARTEGNSWPYQYIFKELNMNSSFRSSSYDRFVAHWVIRDSMLYLRDDLLPRIDDGCLSINADVQDPQFSSGNVWSYSDSLQREINRLGSEIFKPYIPDRKTIRNRVQAYTGQWFDSRDLMPARWFTGTIHVGADFVSDGKSVNQTKITVEKGRVISIESSNRPLARYDKPEALDKYLSREITIWNKLEQAGITKPFRVSSKDEDYGVGFVYVGGDEFTPMFTEDQVRLMLQVRDQVVKAFENIDPKDITSDYLFIQNDPLRKDTDGRWFALDPWVFPAERKVRTMTNFKVGFGY